MPGEGSGVSKSGRPTQQSGQRPQNLQVNPNPNRRLQFNPPGAIISPPSQTRLRPVTPNPPFNPPQALPPPNPIQPSTRPLPGKATQRPNTTPIPERNQTAGRTQTPDHTQRPDDSQTPDLTEDDTLSQEPCTSQQPSTSKGGQSKKKKPPTNSGEPKRTRKGNWCDEEEQVLAEQMREHEARLSKRSKLGLAKKQAVWSRITDRVNSVGSCLRTSSEVQKKWSDLKRRTKEKLKSNYTAARVTGGGGPAPQQDLTDVEEIVAAVIPEETVHGVGGHDSLAMEEMDEVIDTENFPSDGESGQLEEQDMSVSLDLFPVNMDNTEPHCLSGSPPPPMSSPVPSPTQHSDAAASDVHGTPHVATPVPSVPLDTPLLLPMTHTQYVTFQRDVHGLHQELINEVQSGFETVVQAIEGVRDVVASLAPNTAGGTTTSTPIHSPGQSLVPAARVTSAQHVPSQGSVTPTARDLQLDELRADLCGRFDALNDALLLIHQDMAGMLREQTRFNAALLPVLMALVTSAGLRTTVPVPPNVVDTTPVPPRSDQQSDDEGDGDPVRSVSQRRQSLE